MAMQQLIERLRVPTTVVVPLDGSAFAERALPFAVDAVDAFGARLVLLGSCRRGEDLDEVRGYLRSVAVEHGHREAECLVVTEHEAAPAVAIVAGEERGALVVMASHGRGAVGHLVLGSVTEQVLARHAGPVLVVGPQAELEALARTRRGPVVVGIDERDTDDDRIDAATAWAATRHAPIELLSVVETGRADHPRAAEHARVAARVATMGGPDAIPVTSHFVEHHDRAHELAARGEAVGASLVVIGSHAAEGLERLTGGTTAMRVVHRARCPVLVVNPARRLAHATAPRTEDDA